MAGKSFFTIEITGIRDVKGRYAAMRDKGAVRHARGLLKEIGRILVGALREEAPVGRHYTFEGAEYEPPKRLRDSFFYRTYVRGKTIRLSIYSKASKILRFVILGTRPHKRGRRTIRPRRALALALYCARKQKSMVVASVQHPGTLPNLFHERAYRIAKPEIERLQRKAAKRMARSLAWAGPPAPLEVI